MNIEGKEMSRGDESKLLNVLKELTSYESQLKEMTKEELIELLMSKYYDDITPFSADEDGIDLWYYMDAETGTKYITNEFPRTYIDSSSKYPVLLSEGEINIRVPNMMESMFPKVQKDEPPTKVHLTVSF